MIDIHCHILPGVDDGARTLEDSIEMAKAAAEQGIHTIVATPHHRNNQFDNYREDILTRVDELNRILEEENIEVNILPGQETRIYGDLANGLSAKEILPVNLDTPYILVELPTSTVPKYTNKLLYDLQVEGYTPVIVHPERNSELLSKPDKLYELVKSGVLTQVTAASLVGKFGKKIRNFSHEIIQSNLTHFIASDAHNVRSRSFMIVEALSEIEELYGIEIVYNYRENSNRMVMGETIIGDFPERIVRKKFLGIF
ncbi:tyrosine-protein phosphatase [Terribacillus saccharophilus]|uniref:tyrosine-protein phosphatase n=1 Tax=Terribacillus saccharophilus TaxID=361277 RepID=UPI000C9BE8A0|nr:CpsB/CapC family capsule biosynthesis tyrosine phosphatase [Terribacillus goriensis]MEC0282043.1 tyrosine protein phosphatase [Terribacillus saccharophilus]MEC0291168.1 tyrosine protein phosphatase [Terribacillus saccharophilus]